VESTSYLRNQAITAPTLTGMKPLWCWRCGQEMPMLGEEEIAEIARLYAEAVRPTPETKAGSEPRSMDEHFARVRRVYERLTGYVDCHQNAVIHHRLSLFRPPCRACGKPLRTPQAKHCAACGADRAI
jgi:hypothetical protein